jgi:ATPase
VVVNDFETKKLEYELYSYGEETVVVPVREGIAPAAHQLAAKSVENEIRNYASNCEVELVSDHKCIVRVPKKDISSLIGKNGSTISQVEKKLGISIDVQELSKASKQQSVPYEAQISKRAVQFFLNAKFKSKDVDIHVEGDYLLSAKVGKSGVIKIAKNNKIGRILVDAVNSGEKIEILL